MRLHNPVSVNARAKGKHLLTFLARFCEYSTEIILQKWRWKISTRQNTVYILGTNQYFSFNRGPVQPYNKATLSKDHTGNTMPIGKKW